MGMLSYLYSWTPSVEYLLLAAKCHFVKLFVGGVRKSGLPDIRMILLQTRPSECRL
jgi:hypothetical protein